MTVAHNLSPKGNAKHDEPSTVLHFVIENMRQGLWRLDCFGVIQYVNPYLAEWLGATPEAMAGRHFSRYRRLRLVDEGAVDLGLSQRYEAEFIAADGSERWGIVVTSPAVDEDGQPIGTIDLITDITNEHLARTRLAAELQEASTLATIDPLTGVCNRRAFDEVLHALQLHEDSGCFGLLIADLNRFKQLNDRYGHAVGDQALIQVANRLRAAVREGDTIARVGGDEFAVLLPSATPGAMDEVIARLKRKLQFRMRGVRVSVSIGAARCPEDEDVFCAADKRMYEAKARRRKSA